MAEPEVGVAADTAMETEAPEAAGQKREREEVVDPAAEGGEAAVEEAAAAKKPKLEEETKEVEEASEEKAEETAEENTEETAEVKTEEANEKTVEAERKPVKLGPKEFSSAVEMFDYFFGLLHYWTPQIEFNKVRVSVWLSWLQRRLIVYL